MINEWINGVSTISTVNSQIKCEDSVSRAIICLQCEFSFDKEVVTTCILFPRVFSTPGHNSAIFSSFVVPNI